MRMLRILEDHYLWQRRAQSYRLKVRSLAKLLAVPVCAVRPRCQRHDQRLHPASAGATGNAGRYPGSRQRGQRRLYRRFERIGGIRVRSHRRLARLGAGRRGRRRRDPGGYRRLDVALPGAAPNGPVSGKRMKAGRAVDFNKPTHGPSAADPVTRE